MEPPDDLSDSEYLPDAATASTAAPAKPPAPLKQSTLSFDQVPPSVYLPKLNPQQRQAVTAGAEGGLAVHAGPGSGKTAVLTTRVAHLIQVGRIPPEELVCVHFPGWFASSQPRVPAGACRVWDARAQLLD